MTTTFLRRFLGLSLGALIGLYAVLPHLGRRLGEFFAYAAVIAAAAAVGTYLMPRTSLRFRRPTFSVAAKALGIGALTSVVLIALDRLLFAPTITSPPVWTGILYALYGGITQEVVFHYGLMTAVAWVALRVMGEVPSYWIAILVSAIAMGLSGALAPAGFTLLALGGVVTGWLYWRRGLEGAMLAHGVTGFALHVWAPGAFVVF